MNYVFGNKKSSGEEEWGQSVKITERVTANDYRTHGGMPACDFNIPLEENIEYNKLRLFARLYANFTGVGDIVSFSLTGIKLTD